MSNVGQETVEGIARTFGLSVEQVEEYDRQLQAINTEAEENEMTRTTKSGEYLIYHKREAHATDLHQDGPWFFEPNDPGFSSGDVFSDGYPTAEAALEAAEQWEVQAEAEARAELNRELEAAE